MQQSSSYTPRERFLRIMNYQPVDRLPVMWAESYYEEPALKRWRTEGLPADAYPDAFLQLDVPCGVPVSVGALPPFGPRRIGEDEEYFYEIDYMGTTVKRRKDAPSMYYGCIDFPVKSLADWRRYAEHFDAAAPERQLVDFDETVAALNASDTPVGLSLFPFFFRLGFYALGMERFMMAPYDEPELLHEMFAFWSDFYLRLLRPFLGKVRIDYVTIAEDLAYKGGPHFSPAIYREFWLPYQNPIVEEVRRHGTQYVFQWSAGNLEDYIPLLMENGFNGVMPLEVVAGMDPVYLRKKYGRELRLFGGIPKEALIAGPAAIDAALARLRPLMAEGGFVPALDDVVPPEVPWDVFRYYIERLKEIRL